MTLRCEHDARALLTYEDYQCSDDTTSYMMVYSDLVAELSVDQHTLSRRDGFQFIDAPKHNTPCSYL